MLVNHYVIWKSNLGSLGESVTALESKPPHSRFMCESASLVIQVIFSDSAEV